MAEISEKKAKKEPFWPKLIWLFLAFPLVIYFYFGLDHLDKFETVDEHLWIADGARIPGYWDAVGNKNWEATRVNDKPGVTLAIVSGSAYLHRPEAVPDLEDGTRNLNHHPTQEIQKAFRDYRLPILIFNGAIVFYLYWVISKATKNRWIGLIGATLILLQPVLLGLSQIVNPDSLLWSLSAALLFTFLAFLETGQVTLLLLSIIFMGLTLADKYVSVIFFPFLILALSVFSIFHANAWKEEGMNVWRKTLWRSVGYLVVIFGGIVIFALLMPAAIVNLKYLSKGTYDFPGMYPIFRLSLYAAIFFTADALLLKSRILIFISKYLKYPRIVLTKLFFLALAIFLSAVIVNWQYGLNILDVQNFPYDAGSTKIFTKLPAEKQFFLEARPLVFASTPIVLVSVIFFWIFSIFKNRKTDWVLLILGVFIPVYFLAVMKQDLLVQVRYSVMLFPIMSVAAAIALVEFFSWGWLKIIPKVSIFALVLLGSIQILESVRPFYFNYLNDFLPPKYDIVDGWGQGGYEAAQYLNSLPDAQNLRILADYTGVCPFVKGNCVRYTDKTRSKFKEKWDAGEYDYFVISKKGYRRYRLSKDHPWLGEQKPVWQLNINDRPGNFIKVISDDPNEACKSSGEWILKCQHPLAD